LPYFPNDQEVIDQAWNHKAERQQNCQRELKPRDLWDADKRGNPIRLRLRAPVLIGEELDGADQYLISSEPCVSCNNEISHFRFFLVIPLVVLWSGAEISPSGMK